MSFLAWPKKDQKTQGRAKTLRSTALAIPSCYDAAHVLFCARCVMRFRIEVYCFWRAALRSWFGLTAARFEVVKEEDLVVFSSTYKVSHFIL